MSDFLLDRIEAFQRLNKANDLALENLLKLSDLDKSFAERNDGLEAVFDSINVMKNSLFEFLPLQLDFYKDMSRIEYDEKLVQKISKIRKISNETTKLVSDKTLDFTDSPMVAKEITARIFSKLQSVNPKLDGEFPMDVVTIEDLLTPHDLIRYMHRVGTELFFNPDISKWSFPEHLCLRLESPRIHTILISTQTDVDLRDLFEEDPYLARIKNMMDSKKFKTAPSDNRLNILHSKNDLSIQLALGCHYATIRIKTVYSDSGEEQYSLKFKFTNTIEYRTSEFRSEVSDGILKGLGFFVIRNNNIFDIDELYNNQEDLNDDLEELLRFSFSMKNVDYLDIDINGRLEDAISAYMHGVLNLSSYLNQQKNGEFKKFAQDNCVYREGYVRKAGRSKLINYEEQEKLENLVDIDCSQIEEGINQKKRFFERFSSYISRENIANLKYKIRQFYFDSEPVYYTGGMSRISLVFTGLSVAGIMVGIDSCFTKISKDEVRYIEYHPKELLDSQIHVCNQDMEEQISYGNENDKIQEVRLSE